MEDKILLNAFSVGGYERGSDIYNPKNEHSFNICHTGKTVELRINNKTIIIPLREYETLVHALSVAEKDIYKHLSHSNE